MSSTTAYTPLESLLLFQALRSEGVDSHAVFNRISEQLNSIAIVRNDPTFDTARLSPDALRQLYLWLLKEEAKRNVERQAEEQSLLLNGDASLSGSRKRKAPSPSLPTVQEASKHAHLIPQLVTRLYARYRDHTVRDIREHERRYESLAREVDEIEAGEWDERLQRKRVASHTQSPRPSSTSHVQAVSSNLDPKSKTASPRSPQTIAEKDTAPARPYKGNKIGDVINHGPEPQNDSSHHRRNSSSNTTLPPLSEMAPRSPQFGIPPKIPAPINTAFNQSPSSAHQSPYASHHGHPPPGSVASPSVQPSLSRPSSSPRPVLPPPPGMTLPPPSPGQHPASHSLYAPQQYPSQQPHRLPTGLSPANDRAPGYPPPVAGQYPPHPAGYYPPQTYPDRRTSYPQHAQQQIPAGYPPHPGGYQLAPFSVEQQHYAQPPAQPPVPHQQAQRPPSYPQLPPSAPSTSQRGVPPTNPIVTEVIAALATPPPRGKPKGGLKRPSYLNPGTPLPSPAAEPLSPVLKRSEPVGRSTRSTRNRDGAQSEQSAEPEPAPAPRATRARGRTKRERSPLSTVSSTADDSARMTRSHSVSTAAGAIPTSDDRPASRGNVKLEPSTPAGISDALEASHELPSAGGGRMTRKRRGTLQPHAATTSKRSRRHSPDPRRGESEDISTPPTRPNTVLATRNFSKLANTILAAIDGHKYASYFKNPVRDKDVQGYGNIIKRPQNLKAIKAAIKAGEAAVKAALEAGAAESATAAAVAEPGSVLELERSEELVPPRGIVNSAQLEREVMRMFANAVMFNPGDDGMVRDTREMAEDVKALLEQWRGAEKEAGEAEGVGVVHEEEGGKGKRRKL